MFNFDNELGMNHLFKSYDSKCEDIKKKLVLESKKYSL